MNKKELFEIKEAIFTAAREYCMDNNLQYLKGVEYMCHALNIQDLFYYEVNSMKIEQAWDDNLINYTIKETIISLYKNILENDIKIDIIIKDDDILTFIKELDNLNSEIEYINKDTFTANENKLKMIYKEIN